MCRFKNAVRTNFLQNDKSEYFYLVRMNAETLIKTPIFLLEFEGFLKSENNLKLNIRLRAPISMLCQIKMQN